MRGRWRRRGARREHGRGDSQYRDVPCGGAAHPYLRTPRSGQSWQRSPAAQHSSGTRHGCTDHTGSNVGTEHRYDARP
jgi:hypothetical protein